MTNFIQTLIAAAGGSAFVFIIFIKFFANKIADRAAQKYQLELDKRLEQYRESLGNKSYVSRTRFDAEFKIYEDLSEVFTEASINCCTLFPTGYVHEPIDPKEKKKQDAEKFNRAADSVNKAQQILYAKAPLIPEEMEKKYKDILTTCNTLLDLFQDCKNTVGVPSSAKQKNETMGFKESEKLNDDYRQLIKETRGYLNSLDVKEQVKYDG